MLHAPRAGLTPLTVYVSAPRGGLTPFGSLSAPRAGLTPVVWQTSAPRAGLTRVLPAEFIDAYVYPTEAGTLTIPTGFRAALSSPRAGLTGIQQSSPRAGLTPFGP